MKLEKGIKMFMTKWVNNMRKGAPLGKRPRTATAKKLYSDGLRKSIEFIKLKSKPIIQMNLYGLFVDKGHRTRGVTKVPAQPFIDKSFSDTVQQMEEVLPDEIAKQVFKKTDFIFGKYKKIG